MSANHLGLFEHAVWVIEEARRPGANAIEARPVWKPMHRQRVFANFESVGARWPTTCSSGVSASSSSNLTLEQLERVVGSVRRLAVRFVGAQWMAPRPRIEEP